ncbi:lysophospholipid acyltransferase family protein [Aeromonas jandaei]|uniref:lysophospholipid acyltransferase family protein n=1 Tax=Aeromonas jandaei TaxID=650 RepID=UPI001C03DA4F|nr:lysophospholipid acyltransferase family protein [Aeromonas jandaei]QWL67016.1 1-acyl-sn-glycerol-3-phosphate acyltransferase [Aeromonas jandaei]
MAAQLNRLWRLIGTMLGFTLFGIGCLLLTLVWFPLLWLFVRGETRRHLAQSTIRISFRFFLNVLRQLRVLDYRFDNMPQQLSGVLVLANHPSLLDYVLLAAYMPECDCIVKEALWHNPFVAGIVRAAGYIPNAAAETLLPVCCERLQQGAVLLVFPEGTRTTPGEPLQLQRGAAHLAVRCQARLQPVRIHCSAPFLTKQHKWFHVPAHKPLFTVEFLPQCQARDMMPHEEAPSLAARHLTHYFKRVLSPAQSASVWTQDATNIN